MPVEDGHRPAASTPTSLRCYAIASCALMFSYRPHALRELIARLHAHPVLGCTPANSLQARAMFADTPVLPLSRHGNVPCSQPRCAAVSVTFQPTSSMLARPSSPKCGGFSMGPTRSPSALSIIFLLVISGSRPSSRPRLRCSPSGTILHENCLCPKPNFGLPASSRSRGIAPAHSGR